VELSARLDGELLVMVPCRWKHYGKWRAAEQPDAQPFGFMAAKVTWPWMGPGQFYLHWYPGLAKVLRTFRPDVIDLWEEPWGLVSAQVCLLRNHLLPHTRIISETEQNLEKPYPPPFRWFRSYTLRNADFAVGRSAEAIRVLRSQGYNGPSEVVPNAVDSELFHPMQRQECRASLGLNGFAVGYVGRLVERKGLMDLVNALPLCPADTNLIFTGSGEYSQALQGRLRELGLEARARFLPERRLEQLPQLMNAIDLLVLPSWTVPSWKEQFGRVIIEAHACGTPVIGSDSGAIPDVIGQGGLIFPERNPAALAARIRELHDNPIRRLDLGSAGLRRVMENYTWERVAQKMHEIYRGATRLSQPPHRHKEILWQRRPSAR
jgi:glycosyltransferase involved in cell wall biosynthesis